jgi:ABC-2 type transport system permease protein
MKKFWAVFMGRNKEFFKDRGTLGFVVLFPVILIFGFSFAFSGDGRALYKVGYKGELPQDDSFFTTKYIQFIPYDNSEEALQKVKHHQIDFFIDTDQGNYWINPESQKGYIVEKLLESGDSSSGYIQQTVTGRKVRYVDWVFPGILAFNIMMNSLFGVGFVIVRYRKNGVLKRLKATPLTSFEFISAQVMSRFFIIIIVNSAVFLGCHLFLRFLIVGNPLTMLLIAVAGALCFISMGLIFASRLRSEELAQGLINVITWPMMLLSGVWFSLEGSPRILQNIAMFFPLTHFVTALRRVMLEGASLADVSLNILLLFGLSAVFMTVGSLLFNWEAD